MGEPDGEERTVEAEVAVDPQQWDERHLRGDDEQSDDHDE
jgi:hypothetical protein